MSDKIDLNAALSSWMFSEVDFKLCFPVIKDSRSMFVLSLVNYYVALGIKGHVKKKHKYSQVEIKNLNALDDFILEKEMRNVFFAIEI